VAACAVVFNGYVAHYSVFVGDGCGHERAVVGVNAHIHRAFAQAKPIKLFAFETKCLQVSFDA